MLFYFFEGDLSLVVFCGQGQCFLGIYRFYQFVVFGLLFVGFMGIVIFLKSWLVVLVICFWQNKYLQYVGRKKECKINRRFFIMINMGNSQELVRFNDFGILSVNMFKLVKQGRLFLFFYAVFLEDIIYLRGFDKIYG